MNQFVIIKTFFVSCLFLSLSSCVTIVAKTGQIKESFADGDAKLQKAAQDLSTDYQKRFSDYSDLTSRLVQIKNEPYLSLQKELGVMKKQVEALRAEQVSFHSKRMEVETLLGNEQKVPLSHPGYKAAQNVKDSYSDIINRVEAIQKKYSDSAKRYVDIGKKNGIVVVNTNEVINKFETTYSSIQSQLTTYRSQLAEAKTKNMVSKTQSSARREALLQSMNQKVDEIDLTSKQLLDFKEKFLKEAAGRPQFLIGPHLASFVFIEEINKFTDTMHKKGNELNLLAQELKGS